MPDVSSHAASPACEPIMCTASPLPSKGPSGAAPILGRSTSAKPTDAPVGDWLTAILAYTRSERRVERCGHQMEDAVTQVFTRDLNPPESPANLRKADATHAEVGYAACA